jgi:hypothetical protein
MGRNSGRIFFALAAVSFAATCALAQAGADRGRVEFNILLTPISGRPEPARRLTIYLLRKTFREIWKEEEEKMPQPSLDAFVDALPLGKELKDWMKQHHSVTISGPEFRRKLVPDDLFKVPEFLDAYVASNLSGLHQGFPEPKFNPDDRVHNTIKYETAMKTYEPQLRRYLATHPDSLEAMDTILNQSDPSPEWNVVMGHWREDCRQNALAAAQNQYLAAKTDTDLDGRGAFEAAAGTYALSTLDGEALSDNLHLRWDVHIQIHAGDVTRVELNNLNAEKKR